MLEDRISDPQDEENLSVDPPNNTDPGASFSLADQDTAPVDPPNNT